MSIGKPSLFKRKHFFFLKTLGRELIRIYVSIFFRAILSCKVEKKTTTDVKNRVKNSNTVQGLQKETNILKCYILPILSYNLRFHSKYNNKKRFKI